MGSDLYNKLADYFGNHFKPIVQVCLCNFSSFLCWHTTAARTLRVELVIFAFWWHWALDAPNPTSSQLLISFTESGINAG